MERNRSLDILKALGILFVIFGHITHDWTVRNYINSFHMPLFFFVSAFLFNPIKYSSFPEFLRAKVKGLIVPYVFFYMITFLYWFVIESRFRGGDLSWYSQFFGMFYGTYNVNFNYFNCALWFIPCLFSMEILYWFICKVGEGWKIALILLILYVFAIVTRNYLYWLPLGLNTAFGGLVFFGAGSLAKKTKLDLSTVKRCWLIAVICVMILLQWAFVGKSYVGMATLKIGNPVCFIPVAIVGIYLYFALAKLIKKNCILEWIGKNTLVLFALQEPVYRMVIYAMGKVLHIGVDVIRVNVSLSILCTLITLLLIVPFIMAYNKWLRPLFLRF